MNGLIWFEMELVRDFMPVLVTSKFDEDLINNDSARLETQFSHYVYGIFLHAQGHLTPKGVARSDRNSNSSEILFLSSLPASLTKIESTLNALAWRHRFPQNIRHSRASNSKVNGPIRPEIELFRDFMPALVYQQVWQRSNEKWTS